MATTLVVLNVKKIRGLNLSGTPWNTSACYGMTFTFTFKMSLYSNIAIAYKKRIQPSELNESFKSGIFVFQNKEKSFV